MYTPSHYWLVEEEPAVWCVGLTKFATRMLGDLVEYSFGVQEGDRVEIGQVIGWVEGFKAVTDVYCAVAGEFAGVSPRLQQDITVVESDPYGEGWLYQARGTPEPHSVDVHGYIAILDATIDRMLQSRHERSEDA
ncbi:MAG: glycine cleavage system protein H [Acidobacteria bacterium]|nr:glycine cleavage system protein H [Acidobacteriota bacterium]